MDVLLLSALSFFQADLLYSNLCSSTNMKHSFKLHLHFMLASWSSGIVNSSSLFAVPVASGCYLSSKIL